MTKGKKSFKDNPALQFISASGDREEHIFPQRATAPGRELPPENYRQNPLYIEKRTRRVQLVLRPSLYDAIKERADGAGVSFNEYITSLMEKDLEY